jgi:hypothetical protein
MVDKRWLCRFPPSGSSFTRRISLAPRHDSQWYLGRNCILLGIINHRIFRLLALRRGTAEYQSYESYHSYVFERPYYPPFFVCLSSNTAQSPQAARSVVQTLLGVWIFNDLLTVYVVHRLTYFYLIFDIIRNRASSILVILSGTM